jgi:hypothetical protein
MASSLEHVKCLQFELTDKKEGDVNTFLGVKLTNNPDGSKMMIPIKIEPSIQKHGIISQSGMLIYLCFAECPIT